MALNTAVKASLVIVSVYRLLVAVLVEIPMFMACPFTPSSCQEYAATTNQRCEPFCKVFDAINFDDYLRIDPWIAGAHENVQLQTMGGLLAFFLTPYIIWTSVNLLRHDHSAQKHALAISVSFAVMMSSAVAAWLNTSPQPMQVLAYNSLDIAVIPITFFIAAMDPNLGRTKKSVKKTQ